MSPFEIISNPSIGTNFSARLRRAFELILKISLVATVIATSLTPLNVFNFGMSNRVSEVIVSSTFASTIEINGG